MTVLSLFDGMSCGQIALREAGIKVDQYFASEIDRHAISQTQLNFPDTIQLGDVKTVSGYDLPKIDLVLGGSPCQGFSLAGKQLNFDDPRSKLFFEFVRVLNEVRQVNPSVKFLFENVRMRKDYEAIISEHLGVQPVRINSSLVSAQNRLRLYWSNIRVKDGYTDIPQPDDRGIFLKDILIDDIDERYYLKEDREKLTRWFDKVIMTGGRSYGKSKHSHDVCVAMRGRPQEDGTVHQQLEPRADGKTNALTSVQKDNLIISGTFRTFKGDYGFREIKSGKAGTVPARARNDGSGQNVVLLGGGRIRRITPKECAILQTVPPWYKWECSDTQAYKMLGNGWTIEVIKHIFSFI